MSTRRRLFEPSKPKAHLDLTARQLSVLYAVGQFKYLTSTLCAQLLLDAVDPPAVQGSSTGQIIKRELSDLFHSGYLARPIEQVIFRIRTSGSHDMIYCLTPKGRAALVDAKRPGVSYFVKHPASNRLPTIMHTLMAARFGVTLMVATRHRADTSFLFWTMGKHLLSYVRVQGKRAPVVPDAFTGIAVGNELKERHHWFLEADRGTMTHKRYAAKLRAYVHFRAQKAHLTKHGIESFRVLTVTTSRKRRDNLRGQANGLANSDSFLFAAEDDYDPAKPASIFQPIWISGAQGEAQSLIT